MKIKILILLEIKFKIRKNHKKLKFSKKNNKDLQDNQ